MSFFIQAPLEDELVLMSQDGSLSKCVGGGAVVVVVAMLFHHLPYPTPSGLQLPHTCTHISKTANHRTLRERVARENGKVVWRVGDVYLHFRKRMT